MRLVGVDMLNQGDLLAIPVRTNSGHGILNSGVALTDKYISKLKNLGVYKVYIEDERFNDVEVIEALDYKTRNSACQVIKDTYQAVNKGLNINEYAVKDIAKLIVDFTLNFREKGISILATNVVDEYIIEHSINTAIISAFIGHKISYNFNQLCDLVTGALIHDIGRENEKNENTEHVQKGFDVMRKCRGLSLHSSIVCYQHHENYNGSGYPRKIKSSDISEFTRIIRVADMYDNVLQGYGNNCTPAMPHEAFEVILASTGTILDPNIVEVFRNTIIFYPNGCSVTLNNGLKGIVIRQNLGSPQRPSVRIYNETSVIGEIDLLKAHTVFIKEVIAV